ncbi:MAG TPA: helix-turn-helix domain-containing protein [Sphingomicrobium sp.]|jgi:cytoskeletal protein RodZ|nr:helix-turn-helix domain-containing protein [Sphingomicrobium sp.]
MDEQAEATEFQTAGERLRAAREEKGFSLEDVASETRIPLRHLESLEAGDWERLPAPTYTIGFAKSYASAVGLDRADIGEQLRAEMGGQRPDTSTVEHFEPADPARTMPKWLVFSAIAAIILVVIIFSWIRSASLSEQQPAEVAAETQAQPSRQMPAAPPPTQQPVAQGPVVLTATAPAWIRVTDGGDTLFEGVLQPGQTYKVPQTATAPMLRAGAPEALRVTVGQSVAPPVGPAGEVASDVSLLPADLMHAGSAQQPQQPATAQNSLAQ